MKKTIFHHSIYGIFFLLLLSLAGIAQQRKLTGVVQGGKDNIPLEGATISSGNNTRSTLTKADGKFELTLPAGKMVLTVSHVGYETQSVNIGEKETTVSINLSESAASQLNDVVVVGYGTQKKANIIGAISSVDAKDINNRAVTQSSQVLTGQMPGVTVIQRSGRPGASSGNIAVRGVGSFGASPTALVLIDGVPGNIDNIDPNDIASVSVLKDAASAAIYGARAANGVVLVTTKFGQGPDGKLRVSYNGYMGTQRATKYPKFVNSADFATATNEATGTSTYSQADVNNFRSGTNPDAYPNTDWISLMFKKGTLQTGHNLSVANKTKNTQYVLSFGYMYQNGIVVNNNFKRYNIRYNMINNLTSTLKLTTSFSAIQNATHEPDGLLGLISGVVRAPAIYASQLSDGTFGGGMSGQGTPYSQSKRATYNNTKDNNFLLNTRLDWEIIKGLTASAIAGYTNQNIQVANFVGLQVLNPALTLGPASLTQSSEGVDYKTLQELLQYKKSIDRHNFDLLVGHTYEYNFDRTFSAYRSGFPTNTLTELNGGDASTQTNAGTAAEWALDSYFGRFQYNFASKYLIEATVRRDGSSRFPPTRRYATFPGFAAGWRISNEPFFKEALPWVTDLKFRASYGTLGNQNIGNYPWQNVLVTGSNYSIGDILATGAAVSTLVDTTIHWESTRSKDIGVEGTAFNSKLSFSAGYFDRYTYDILVSPSASVSSVLGFGIGVSNSGKLSNKGWEFTLGYRDAIGKFTYSVRGNFSIINNKVLNLGVGNITQPNGMIGNGSTLFIGYPTQLYYGYKTDGLFTDTTDIKGYATQTAINAAPKPGDIRYKDISGAGGKPDGKVDATYDRTVLGSNIPKYTFGFNLNAAFKGFDIGLFLQGVAKVSGYLDTYAGWAFYQNGNIQQWMYDDHWTPSNPNRNAKYPRLEQISNQGTGNTLTSDYWMRDGSYVRIKNIQLGYTFDKPILSRLKIQSLRLYASGENMATFTKYPAGWDPEINTGGSYYPILANYTFGLNVNF